MNNETAAEAVRASSPSIRDTFYYYPIVYSWGAGIVEAWLPTVPGVLKVSALFEGARGQEELRERLHDMLQAALSSYLHDCAAQGDDWPNGETVAPLNMDSWVRSPAYSSFVITVEQALLECNHILVKNGRGWSEVTSTESIESNGIPYSEISLREYGPSFYVRDHDAIIVNHLGVGKVSAYNHDHTADGLVLHGSEVIRFQTVQAYTPRDV